MSSKNSILSLSFRFSFFLISIGIGFLCRFLQGEIVSDKLPGHSEVEARHIK